MKAARVLSLASIALTLFARDPLSIILGLLGFWLAIRIEFDIRIFKLLEDGRLTLEQFDEAALRLQLMPSGKAGRPIEQRRRGANRLALYLGVIVIMQIAALAVRSFLKS